MTPRERADAYLTIPVNYGAALGGVWWAHNGDAIDRGDGSTLVLVEELTDVLAGVFARPPVPPFAYVLNVLHLAKRPAGAAYDGLRRAYAGARKEAAVSRNFGLLVGELCRGLAPAPDPPADDDIAVALTRLRRFGERRRPGLGHEPPLTRTAFEREVALRLRTLGDAALGHWLAHGSGPVAAGPALAAEVESLPARIARLVALARKRPRLVGAAALTPSLDAALTLPPRRRSPDALPQGGYADVTTRGDPGRLLPSQFALDPDEFVRRFAANELLYFKREEPHAAERPERVVVVDQGVRTWGGVRLGLAAAALSLLRADPRRAGPVSLHATSTPDAVDPTTVAVDALADLLEASDLTAHPGDALGRVLQSPPDRSPLRDIVLLTHPRALRESVVAAAARERRPGDRLFALTVDADGSAAVHEWADGGLTTVRTFRVDLTAAEAARVAGEPPDPVARPVGTWTGDVEPVGFPFRPGLVAEPTSFGFDAGGEWAVAAGENGVLHGISLDGSPPEVLPRAFTGGAVLEKVEAVLGVAGGVVVCGRLKLRAVTVAVPSGSAFTVTVVSPNAPAVAATASDDRLAGDNPYQFVAAHYDRSARRVTAHLLGPAGGSARWVAFPDLSCVLLRVAGGEAKHPGCAVDLANGTRFTGSAATEAAHRARVAWERPASGGSPPHTLPVYTKWTASGADPRLFLLKNTIRLARVPGWGEFEPERDGKPLLAGVVIKRAQLAGDILALALQPPAGQALVLFQKPYGRIVSEPTDDLVRGEFALSPDGRLVARCRPRREVAVQETVGGRVLTVAAAARLHANLEVELTADPFRLTVRVGEYEHVFEVSAGRLAHLLRRDRLRQPRRPRPKSRTPARPPTAYAPARFPAKAVVEDSGWWAAVDRLGQVVLFRDGGPVVAAFLIRRELAAAAGPGGVLWGAPALLGGPATPDADRAIGLAILSAGV